MTSIGMTGRCEITSSPGPSSSFRLIHVTTYTRNETNETRDENTKSYDCRTHSRDGNKKSVRARRASLLSRFYKCNRQTRPCPCGRAGRGGHSWGCRQTLTDWGIVMSSVHCVYSSKEHSTAPSRCQRTHRKSWRDRVIEDTEEISKTAASSRNPAWCPPSRAGGNHSLSRGVFDCSVPSLTRWHSMSACRFALA
jgi:hypothetical protein